MKAQYKIIYLLAGLFFIIIFLFYKSSLKSFRSLNKVILVGQYQLNDSKANKPLLVSIDALKTVVEKIRLNNIDNDNFSGIHEARTFMIGKQYYLALATYFRGKLIIYKSDKSEFNSLKKVFEDVFDEFERVRALYIGDVDNDGKTDVVIGTRPSGFLKYYHYKDGQWIGSIIDNVGSTIHDLIVIDSDKDGRNEIIVTTSTVPKSGPQDLKTKIPEIIQYKLKNKKWIKSVIWQPEKLELEDGIFDHARYIFSGNFTNNQSSELVTGIVGRTSGLKVLLNIKWNGKGYSKNLQVVNDDLRLDSEVITHGDIDNDGREEIVVPTMFDGALVSIKWSGNRWEKKILLKDITENGADEKIISSYILDSSVNNYRQIICITANNKKTGYINVNLLSYNLKSKQYEKKLIKKIELREVEAWGIFPLDSWKIIDYK